MKRRRSNNKNPLLTLLAWKTAMEEEKKKCWRLFLPWAMTVCSRQLFIYSSISPYLFHKHTAENITKTPTWPCTISNAFIPVNPGMASCSDKAAVLSQKSTNKALCEQRIHLFAPFGIHRRLPISSSAKRKVIPTHAPLLCFFFSWPCLARSRFDRAWRGYFSP